MRASARNDKPVKKTHLRAKVTCPKCKHNFVVKAVSLGFDKAWDGLDESVDGLFKSVDTIITKITRMFK